MTQRRELPRFVASARRLLRLRDDTDEGGTIARITAEVDFRGGTPWALILAIVIASVGLNVNSTAVIIGAMLISPLMDPIMGAGLGLGINDVAPLRRSVRNLLIAVETVPTVVVAWRRLPSSADRERIRRFLTTRLKADSLSVRHISDR